MLRCPDCDERLLVGAGAPRRVLGCRRCTLPFEVGEAPTDGLCSDCRSGVLAADFADQALACAAEREVWSRLVEQRQTLQAPGLCAYLTRVSRTIAPRFGLDAQRIEVGLLVGDAWTVQSLPSGRLVLSAGALRVLANEAQLVFALSRELAHLAEGATAAAWVRSGLPGIAEPLVKAGRPADPFEELTALGRGDERERASDQAALDAMLGLGYEGREALRLLDRLAKLQEEASPIVAALSCATPSAGRRRRALESRLRLARRTAGGRINREPYRRALGAGRSEEARPGDPFAASDATGGAARVGPSPATVATGLAIVLLTTALLLATLLLAS